jgi:hypothetical protein
MIHWEQLWKSRGDFLLKLKLIRLIPFWRKVLYIFTMNIWIDVYDTVGSNGIFTSNPSVVKFAGFEVRKTHTQKVKLTNNSAAP